MNFTFLLPCHLFGNYFTPSDIEMPNLKLISVFPIQIIFSFLSVILISYSSAEFFFRQRVPFFPASKHHYPFQSSSLLQCFHLFPDWLVFTYVCRLNARVLWFPILNCVRTSASSILPGVVGSVLNSVCWFPSQHFHLLRKI